MTTQEFFDQIATWSELIEFCVEHDLTDCDNIVADDEMDALIQEAIENINPRWETLRDYLYNIDPGYYYYRRNDSFDFDPLDDNDLETYKYDIAYCNPELFDEEDEEEPESTTTEDEEECEEDQQDELCAITEDFTEENFLNMVCDSHAILTSSEAVCESGVGDWEDDAEEMLSPFADDIGELVDMLYESTAG